MGVHQSGTVISASALLFLGRLKNTLRLKRKSPGIKRENEALVAAQCGWGLLTSRTAVLTVRKPGARTGPKRAASSTMDC